jgi:hypothetical protein
MAKLMELMGERGELKTCKGWSYATMHEEWDNGNWPDRGELTITTHKPKTEIQVWAWAPKIKSEDGREMGYPQVVMWGKLRHSIGKPLTRKGVTFESTIQWNGVTYVEVEGGTFKEKNIVGRWKTTLFNDQNVPIEVVTKDTATTITVKRTAPIEEVVRLATTLEGPVGWRRLGKQPPIERGWRCGDRIRVWPTADDIPIETRVWHRGHPQVITIRRNTTHEELAQALGLDPREIHSWSGNPPWTDETNHITVKMKDEWQREIQEQEDKMQAETERKRQEAEDEEDTPLVEWTREFTPDPSRWRIEAESEAAYIQRAGELEHGRWREEISRRLEPIMQKWFEEDDTSAHSILANRIDRIWERANQEDQWVLTIGRYGWHLSDEEMESLVHAARQATKAGREEGAIGYKKVRKRALDALSKECRTPKREEQWWTKAGQGIFYRDVLREEVECLVQAGGPMAEFHRSEKDQNIVVTTYIHDLEIDDEGRRLMRQIAAFPPPGKMGVAERTSEGEMARRLVDEIFA